MNTHLQQYKSLLILLAIGAFFAFGFYLGTKQNALASIQVANTETSVETTADFKPFWEVWKLIEEKYPGNDTTDQEKVWGAIKGLVGSLEDPYSAFLTPEETKSFEQEIQGEFGGLGIEIGMKDNILTVIAPLKNTPAERAGLKSGDKILKVGEKLTADLTIDEAIELMRGEPGTKVTLTIYRDGEGAPREVEITRGVINIPTIDTELRSDNIFVISLYSFTGNSPKLFQEALQEFNQSGSKKLVLDLRGNPGGYLEAAIDMASWFLPSGKTVVIEDFGSEQKEKAYRSKGYDAFSDIEMVILVDEGSASASEILAGALREHGKAKLVGQKTYGKGSVQELVGVTKSTSLKITVAKWLTPNRVSISEQGLTPDYEVSISKEDIENDKDPQMDKAIEVLKK